MTDNSNAKPRPLGPGSVLARVIFVCMVIVAIGASIIFELLTLNARPLLIGVYQFGAVLSLLTCSLLGYSATYFWTGRKL
jgi:hypothetical protein